MQSSIEHKFSHFLKQEGLPDSLIGLLDWFYLPLAEYIVNLREENRPLLLGVNGGQGSGKSTTSEIICLVLQDKFGLNCASLSLDDLYLTKAERQQMAEDIHPLFKTRGVPGTHDLKLGNKVFDQVRAGQQVTLPRFNKMADDRAPETEWSQHEPLDVLIMEGWCVGAKQQDDVQPPINLLEQEEDKDCIWRNHVNDCLKNEYADFFSRLDALIMLAVPSMEKIYEWRELQEQKLEQNQGSRGMSVEEVQRFIMHYERLTRWMLQEMPQRTDVLVPIGDDHSPEKLIFAS